MLFFLNVDKAHFYEVINGKDLFDLLNFQYGYKNI